MYSPSTNPKGSGTNLNINELKKLTQIASALCQTSSSAINLMYEKEVINLTGHGDLAGSAAMEDSFCQYTIKEKDQVLIVEDPKVDARFKKNKYVKGAPYLRFYAGAPIVSSTGDVLGTLCVQDEKPKKLCASQKKALLNLAHLATHYMNQQKKLKQQDLQISHADERLQLVSDHAPGALFQFTVTEDRKFDVPFISKGIEALTPWLKREDVYQNPEVLFDMVHPEDRPHTDRKIARAFKNVTSWYNEYRIIAPDGNIYWQSSKAKPSVSPTGEVTWYGTIQDVTVKREYIASLEKLIADISHVLRRPITTMKGLIELMETDQLSPEEMKSTVQYIDNTFTEFDEFTRDMNKKYQEKKEAFIKMLG